MHGIKAICRFFLFAVILPHVSVKGDDAGSALSEMQRKHKTKIEVWSLCTKLKNGSGNEFYFAVYFLSGKFILFSGNYVHYCALKMPMKEYTHQSSAVIAPFGKIKHDYATLDENIGGNTISNDTPLKTICITADFSRLKGTFYLSPEKRHLTFKDVIGKNYGRRKFDWYMLPRCGVKALMTGSAQDTLYGNGHFQQFWGKNGEGNCDWFTVHTESDYDLIIAVFPESKKNLPWLPGDYVMISRPDGTMRKSTAFEYKILEWWTNKRSNKKYPISVQIVIPEEKTDLIIKALKEDQVKEIAGKEYWYGFGSLEGTLNNEKQIGWAFLSPLGVEF